MATAAFSQAVSGPPPHRVLVSGANGFVGRAVVRELMQRDGFEVIAATRKLNASRDSSSTQPPASSGDEFRESSASHLTHVLVGDLDSDTNWSFALHGVRTVVHCAARVHVMDETSNDPLREFRLVNVQGTLHLARQAIASGARRFVFVSSVKVNGEAGRFSETDEPHPVDPYGVSKLEAENGLRELARTTGLEVVIVRPPLVYGPGVKANFRALINLVARGVPLPFGAINNRRSFVAVDNLANFLVACVTNQAAANQTFLISDGSDLSTTDLLHAIARAMHKPARLLPVPSAMMNGALSLVGKGAMADRLFGSLSVDITKARTLLQWTPCVSVDEALQRTVPVA